MLEEVLKNCTLTLRTSVMRRVLALPLVFTLVVVFTPSGLSWLGHWLIVADPLAHAQAIVVLSGHLPFRAMEAASIYHQGWAPEVWLTKGVQPAEERALAQLGVQTVGEATYNRAVLQRLGVPPSAIRVLDEGAQNTAIEVRVVAQELQKVSGDSVILITSKPHSRRLQATWWALVGNSPHAIVRYAAADPYDPSRWWQETKDALAVSREVFGLMNVWAGFPVGNTPRLSP